MKRTLDAIKGRYPTSVEHRRMALLVCDPARPWSLDERRELLDMLDVLPQNDS